MQMVPLTDDDLDGVSEGRKYPDGTVVRAFCMRTDRDAYPSGWAYRLHYGATEPDPPRTLEDGTICRYLENRRFSTTRRNGDAVRDDNSHEDTKGHELHVAPDPDPDIITFPGMVELWERVWSEIPKAEFEVE